MASLETWRLILPYCDYASKLSARGASSPLRAVADEALARGRLWVTDDGGLTVRAEEGVLPSSHPECSSAIAGAGELLVPLGSELGALLPRVPQRTRIVANHYHDPPADAGAWRAYDLRGRRRVGLTLDPYCDCRAGLVHDARDVAVSVLRPANAAHDEPECGVAAGVLAASVRRLRVTVEGDPTDLVFASMAMFTKDPDTHPELEVLITFRAPAPSQARQSSRDMWASYLGIPEERVSVICAEEGEGEERGTKRKRLE